MSPSAAVAAAAAQQATVEPAPAGPVVPDDVARKLLEDPAVQQIMQERCVKTGNNAAEILTDGEVQKTILQACSERFPEHAAQAKQRMSEFAIDPDVQNHARQAMDWASHYLGQGGALVITNIEVGPTPVRCCASLAAGISAIRAAGYLLNPLGLWTDTVVFVLAAYQLLFAITTGLFEVKVEWVQSVASLDSYQNTLIDKAKFTSETVGRGLFFAFQGALWMCFTCHWSDTVCGACLVFVGTLFLFVHYCGFTTLAEKVTNGYRALAPKDVP